MAAACLLAALGNEEHATEAEEVRAYTGALLLAEYLDRVPRELEQLRRDLAEMTRRLAG